MRAIMLVVLVMLLCGCAAADRFFAVMLPSEAVGDAERGRVIFQSGINDAPSCQNCHALSPTAFAFAPDLLNVTERAATRVDGLNAHDYLMQSILEPTAYIVPGYRNMMYVAYADHLTEQDLADLIAFIESL